MDQLIGVWQYTKDPSGQIPFETFAKNTRHTFAPDGSIDMTMGNSSMKLEGSVAVRTKSPLVLDVDWGQGRLNVYHVTIREPGHIVIREGEEPGGRMSYFVKIP